MVKRLQREPAASRETQKYHVEGWERSGLSGPDYSERAGVVCRSLYNWKSNLKKAGLRREENAGNKFSVVTLDKPLTLGSTGLIKGITVKTPRGVKVKIEEGLDVRSLGMLINMLQAE